MLWRELDNRRSETDLVRGRVLYIHVHTDLYIDLCVCVHVVSIIIATFAKRIENAANEAEQYQASFFFF